MKKLLYLLLLVFPMQLALAQTAAEDAQMALAVEIANQLNNDDDPNNDVDVPTTLDDAAAVIAVAPAAVVTAAIATVTEGASPQVATAVAAFATINNSDVSIADAAGAASVPEAAVRTTATGALGQFVAAAVAAGNVSDAGGTPNAEDIVYSILNDPDVDIEDVLPGVNQTALVAVINAFIESNPDLLTTDQLANLQDFASGSGQ